MTTMKKVINKSMMFKIGTYFGCFFSMATATHGARVEANINDSIKGNASSYSLSVVLSNQNDFTGF
jgi:hypothetical protein